MKRVLALLSLSVSGCIVPPAQVSLDAKSKDGLILVEVDPTAATYTTHDGRTGVLNLNYFMTFSRYPKNADVPALGDWVHVNVWDPKDVKTRFYAARAPAGTYVLEALNVGGGVSWGVCFNRSTVVFDLPAGEVVYLGRLSPRQIFQDIDANLPASLPMGTYRYLFDRTAPSFEPAQSVEAKMNEIGGFLERVYPRVHAPVRIGELRPASFQSGTPSAIARYPRCAKTE